MAFPYNFNPDDARRFANEFGFVTYKKGKELIFRTCPICQAKGKGNEKTFSINLDTGVYHCFRGKCKDKDGNMVTLAKLYGFSLGRDFDEYYRPKKRYRTFRTPPEPIKPKPEAVQYLESRGISQSIAERYEITTQINNTNILVFPFYDGNGKLTFIKYRKTDFDKEKDNNKEWAEKDGKPILFGMKQCEDGDTLIITEGQIDSLSVAEAGYNNAVSVPTGAGGFTWIPHCWDWINKFKQIIVFGDHEDGHITLLDDIAARFPLEVFHVREEDYLDCKDANEILQKYGKEQICQCIKNAIRVPINDVLDLADVQDIDIAKIEKLETGIRQLDSLLYGGLPFGGLHIISGRAGEGKSTLASQILISAREHGYKCFAYSGELPARLFKAWMNLQVAGRNNIFEYQNDPYGNAQYGISQINKNLISEWYRDRIFIYDSMNVNGGVETQQSLLSTTENVIQQYGVRVILLDNLMTAMAMDMQSGNDQYERQTDFVNKLRSLAVKYNVMILLVAHKRKNGGTLNDNDEVAGSSNIVNLAMLTMSYERDRDLPDEQRRLKVSKNRLFGKLETEGFVLDFDERSKRIYGHGDNLDREYSWSPDNDGFVDTDDIVFD